MGKKKKKDKKIKKPKPKCCGKFRKKNKHCSRCPVLFREQCKLDTESSEMSKKKERQEKGQKEGQEEKREKEKISNRAESFWIRPFLY